MELAKALFSSKKFVAFLIGLGSTIAVKWGLDADLTKEVAAITASYLVGQGIADNGKEAVKEQKKSESAE